jgi:hypothetical protein
MPDTPPPSTRDQHYLLARKLIDLGYTSREDRLAELSRRLAPPRPVAAFAALTRDEAGAILEGLAADQHARQQDATLASLRADGWAV